VPDDLKLILGLLRHFWPSALILAIPLMMTVALARSGLDELRAADTLFRTGVQTEVRIHDVTQGNPRRSPRYGMDYSFVTEAGETRRQRGQTPRGVTRHAAPGDQPTLWYLPHNPAHHSFDPLRDRAQALQRLGLAGLFGLITLGAGGVLGRPVVSAARALRSGPVRRAQVTAHATRPGPRGAALPVLEWRDAAGATGWLRMGEHQPRARYPVGSWSVELARDPATGRDWWLADF